MYLGKADVNTYDRGADREFLVSNGAGSYGSSTVIGANTRSEHGLLVVRPENSEQHAVLVSKLEETLIAHNKKYQLSTNRYKDLIFPDGYRYLQECRSSPYPDMLFVIHSIFLKKSLYMPPQGTCTVVRYELMESPEAVDINVRPLFAHRPNNTTCPEQNAGFMSEEYGGVINVSGRGYLSHVSFTDSFSSFGGSGEVKWLKKTMWVENLIYERDAESNKPPTDSLWSPGYGAARMNRGDVLYVVLSQEPLSYNAAELEAMLADTVGKQKEFERDLPRNAKNSMAHNMIMSARHLVMENEGSAPAILSGFPSARKRARDTFIALPGLTLATGHVNTAKGILESWLSQAEKCRWIMPSHVDSGGHAVTGDIDSGLWFLYAVQKYSAAAGFDFAKERFGELSSVLENYAKNLPELGVVMDADNYLLNYFNETGARNWMSGDADGEPLVDRRGFLVEVNALWYNALRFMEELAVTAGDGVSAKKYTETAQAAAKSFERVFWNEKAKYLYDWVDADGKNSGDIRPNAILAISLPYSALHPDMGRAVLSTCWDHLYTTYGLRTLDPHHEKFKGRAEGRPDQKKKARLRGMAWPWLLGNFIAAYMRFNQQKEEMGWSFMRPFLSHMRRGCLGGVAEYFDGVMPYNPYGDVLSAISSGELLRVINECLIEN